MNEAAVGQARARVGLASLGVDPDRLPQGGERPLVVLDPQEREAAEVRDLLVAGIARSSLLEVAERAARPAQIEVRATEIPP